MNRRRFLESSAAFSSMALCGLTQAGELEMGLCSSECNSEEPQPVRLRSGENPYGPPPAAIEAVTNELTRGNQYPRTPITQFREKIAADTSLTPDHVAIGAGSIELILNAAITFGKPGRAIVSGDPTWNTLMLHAQKLGADWIRVPLTKSYRYDFDRMLSAINDKVDLVYLCHPNNPTGIAENHDELQAFVKEVAKTRPVMIDEAFIDCLENAESLSMKKLLPAEENVIIVRTFSKLWGMAGFRVGYLLGNPRLVAQLKSTVPALEMQSRFGAIAGMAAYGDEQFISMSRQKMRESQQQIYEILGRHGLNFIASDCNFISFQVPLDSQVALEKMVSLGVQLKKVSLSDNKNWLRVSCGKPAELQAFDTALAQLV